jgi:hypothetical protein
VHNIVLPGQTPMRTANLIVFSVALLLSACSKEEDQAQRHPLAGADLVGQDHTFKVESDEWETYGTPGDDTFGYEVVNTVPILTDAVLLNGTVRVLLRRSGQTWAELPLWIGQGAPNGLNWRAVVLPNKVRIRVDRNGESFDPPDEVMVFKVVVFGG